jgi:hypothetical protein
LAALVLPVGPGHAQASGGGDTRKDDRGVAWDGWRFGVVHGGSRASDTKGSRQTGASRDGASSNPTARRTAKAGQKSGQSSGQGSGGAAGGASGGGQSAAAGGRSTTGTGKNGFQVLYDAEPGIGFQKPIANATKYAIVYQDDADQGARIGRIDASKVVARVRTIFDEGGASPWGVLDFEDPYDDIFRAGPSDPRYGPAVESLVETIRQVKQQFPQTKWTYYAFPRVPYWIGAAHDKQWVQVDAATRAAEFDQVLERYGPLMNELDWFMPSVYDVYERALDMPVSLVGRDEAEADYRRASVEVVQRWFAQQGTSCPPIVPVVSPWFQPGGRALKNRAIPLPEFVEDQVRPLAEAGASGIAIWSAMDWFIDVSTRQNALLSATGQAAREEMRGIFAAEYLRTHPDSVDWGATATRRTLGDSCNATLRQAMVAIAQTGESVRQNPPASATRPKPGSVVVTGEIVAKSASGE